MYIIHSGESEDRPAPPLPLPLPLSLPLPLPLPLPPSPASDLLHVYSTCTYTALSLCRLSQRWCYCSRVGYLHAALRVGSPGHRQTAGASSRRRAGPRFHRRPASLHPAPVGVHRRRRGSSRGSACACRGGRACSPRSPS